MADEAISDETSEAAGEWRSIASTPTWSIAVVLALFIVVSLILERAIHALCNWLEKTKQKSLLAAMEKMKEELLLLGFMSLLLTATSRSISSICVPAKINDGAPGPCSKTEADESTKSNGVEEQKHVMAMDFDYEPFVSDEGLEQLHHFIFIMALTHVSYSCLTMVLANMKVHSWRAWEDEAHLYRQNSFMETTGLMLMQRQSFFARLHSCKSRSLVWATCFFRQFGHTVDQVDYLTLRQGFITSHNLSRNYDFHRYVVRTMEEEFQMIVGVSFGADQCERYSSKPNHNPVACSSDCSFAGSNLYFWIALLPSGLVLVVGAKLEHVSATLAMETAGLDGSFSRPKFRTRDELFWFKKPELLLSVLHFILFQNAFHLATFIWFLMELGFNSCFIHSQAFLGLTKICRAILVQLQHLASLCSGHSGMGTHYKAALIPDGVRETIHGWGKEARRRRRKEATDCSETATVISTDDDDDDEETVVKERLVRRRVPEPEPAAVPPSVMESASILFRAGAAGLGERKRDDGMSFNTTS
ncbi:hypothetical protein M569_10123 [Genlisea aurea]|uniref:MLO-like protein n=1 Tax=Genlisea aurea TaxID=192259 RepID=S8DXG2_9LAMI|nr:hypothetical protein M569_10123 [Genlisea aurea]